MHKFGDLGITVNRKTFEGDKIKMSKVLDKEIIVYDFKLEDSKASPEKGNGKCLYLQISLKGEKHIIFTTPSKIPASN